MDISSTLTPNSSQLDAVDLVSGERTFTVTKATVHAGQDQPLVIDLAEFPRPWKPGLTMRRLLAHGWGTDSSKYIGRQVTLYNDPDVIWAGKAVGGVRIKALSDMPKKLIKTLPENSKKYKTFEVDVLSEPVTEPWVAQWQAIRNALVEAGYEGDGPALLVTAGQVIGSTWEHPNQISAEDAQAILAAVREDNQKEN